jgi:predicted O-linked N-acetylglucosamine transferase (SPINDLY family)
MGICLPKNGIPWDRLAMSQIGRRRWAKIRRVTIKISLKQAVALHQQGELTEAKAAYLSILNTEAENADALHLLGLIAYQEREYPRALDLINQAIALKPNMAGFHSNKGLVLKELGQLESALASYQQALVLQPGSSNTYSNQGIVYAALRRYKEALQSYDLAIASQPDNASAHYNRGNVLFQIKKIAAAIASYDKAIAHKPDYHQAFDNRGIAHKATGQIKKALADHERAIAIKPDYVEAHYNRALALCEAKDFESAASSFKAAVAIQPHYPFLLGSYLHSQMQTCDWNGLQESLNTLQSAVSLGHPVASPFVLTGLLDDPALHKQAATLYAQTRFPESNVLGPFPIRKPGEKIRIGYYSADFRNHAIAYLIAEMLEQHDKEAFEIYALNLNPGPRDAMSARLFAAVTQVVDLADQSDRSAAQLSRALGIDIAVDLGGHTMDSRTGIFAYRCAPVQVSYLGFPGSLGAPYYDYVLADRNVIPPDQSPYYSEQIVYLPHCYQVNDSKRKVADRVFLRSELGLPEKGFVFCCFNNGYKILPPTFDGWMRMLQAVPGSVLWLLNHNHLATQNLQREAQQRGVDPRRLVFAPRAPLADHLARHKAADLFVDTLPYNAHTTASDALWAGLPVLTCMGKSFASRVAGSLLLAIGLPELITHTQAEFEAKAIAYATNPVALQKIKGKLLENLPISPLFNAELFTRHIEQAYRVMHARQGSGLPPKQFAVAT